MTSDSERKEQAWTTRHERVAEMVAALDALDLTDRHTLDEAAPLELIGVTRPACAWRRVVNALDGLQSAAASPPVSVPEQEGGRLAIEDDQYGTADPEAYLMAGDPRTAEEAGAPSSSLREWTLEDGGPRSWLLGTDEIDPRIINVIDGPDLEPGARVRVLSSAALREQLTSDEAVGTARVELSARTAGPSNEGIAGWPSRSQEIYLGAIEDAREALPDVLAAVADRLENRTEGRDA